MFLHLGGEVHVPLSHIIVILAIRQDLQEGVSGNFMRSQQELGRVVHTLDGEPKSCIITDTDVYLSPIASMTLKKRAIQQIRELGGEVVVTG